MRRVIQIGVATLLVGYLGACVFLYTQQRRLLFPIPPTQGKPASWIPETGNVVVYFHGNAESAAGMVWMLEIWRGQGVGFHAIEYPGYGGTPGSPSEAAIYEAAQKQLSDLHLPPDRVVLFGQSLGTGPAVEMALHGFGKRLVLLSPFTSIGDTAQSHLPMFPAKWLVKDQFDTASKAARVKMPVLLVHGDEDEVVPFSLSLRLAPLFPYSDLLKVSGGHHNDLWGRQDVLQRVTSFVTK